MTPDPLPGFISPDQPTWTARAPGRLDVMGGIADYSGALVLQLPLDRATTALVQHQAAPRCDVWSRRDGQWHRFGIALEPLVAGALREPQALRDAIVAQAGDHWPAYPIGVVQHVFRRLMPARRNTDSGLRILIDSDVPEGKGVSSSAAIEVSVMAAVAASQGIALAPETCAAACQWVENHVVGAPCGIMDQMTSACGHRDALLRLRCQPGTIEGYSAIPHGYRFYGIDSGLRHAVTGSDYVTVRTAAFMGSAIIAKTRGHDYLANIPATEFRDGLASLLPERMTGADFLARFGGIQDTVTHVDPARSYPVRTATAHPVFEQERVTRFAALLDVLGDTPDAAQELGQLMAGSHASYSACGLGSDGTDRLVELVANAGPAAGLFGAKITGGGSGGTVAVLGRDTSEPAVRAIARRYAEETGHATDVFARSGPGTAELGVTRT